ncbi:MAG: RNA polymerase sigma factor [Planctomycetota bacterium]
MSPTDREPQPGSSNQEPSLSETAHLIDLVRSGDQGAADKLFGLYLVRLSSFMHGRLGERHRRLQDTSDVVQVVLARVYERLDQFENRGVGSFWAFLRQCAMNEVRTVWRRSARRREESLEACDSAADEVPAPDGQPSDFLLSNEMFESFEVALGEHPDKVQKAVILKLELGLDYRTIAADCDFPTPDAAGAAIRRALSQIARRMGSHE